CVLVVINEHVVVRAPRDTVLRCDQFWMASRKFDGKRLGKRPDFLLRGATNNWNVDVNPSRAGRLGVTRNVNFSQRFSDDESRFTYESEGSAGCGIEIEMQIVGPIDIIAARVPRIQVDASKVHDPQQGRKVLYHGKIDHVSRVMFNRAD